MRKTTIVALARKLLVALWKYSISGVVIEGCRDEDHLSADAPTTIPPIPGT